MTKRTIGILATSVAVCALCIVTDASAIAGGGHGGGGGGGHGAVVTAVAGLLEHFTVEAVAGMAAGTWVMGGVAMHGALTAGLTRTP